MHDLGTSTAGALVASSYLAAKDFVERGRREEAARRQDAYEDDYADVLTSRISETFAAVNAKELVKVLDTTNNPLKRIVNEVSCLYSRRPARNLANPSASALYRQILRRAGDGVTMPRLNRMVNLHNTVLVYVRPSKASLTLRLILPQDCTVWDDPDDPTMPLCVEFRECGSAPNAKPVYWQYDRRAGSEGIRSFDANGKLLTNTALPYSDESGPVLPIFAVHREWPLHSFWDHTSGADLYELTMMVGMWETWINYLIRTDSTQQKWASGQVDAGSEQTGGPTSLLSLRSPDGEAVSVGQFSSQSDWNGLGNQIKRKYDGVLYSYGLVAQDTRSSGDPTSGFALKIRSQGLYKIQGAQVPSYERSEETMYRVIAAVWNFERENSAFPLIKGPTLPPFDAAGLEVGFAPIESDLTVEERAAEQAMDRVDIDMGLASPVTIYVRRNPQATEDEAKAAIEKNQADTASLKPKPKPSPIFAMSGGGGGAGGVGAVNVTASAADEEPPEEE